MGSESIVVQGTIEKNKTANILIIGSIVAFVVAIIFASYAYNNMERYFSLGWGYGGTWYYSIGYDDDFMAYFTGEFFSLRLMYGYIMIASVIALIVGIIIKKTTEGCEITVSNSRIYGKCKGGNAVDIPLNQVTALNSASFNGISVSSIGRISTFHLLTNREEVMKGISFLLANGGNQQNLVSASTTQTGNGGEAEKIMQYKDLLDSGVISQEEFDAKKRQILEL